MDRKTVLLLAAEAELDVRTVAKACEHGVSSLRSEVDRARLREAARRLKVKLSE